MCTFAGRDQVLRCFHKNLVLPPELRLFLPRIDDAVWRTFEQLLQTSKPKQTTDVPAIMSGEGEGLTPGLKRKMFLPSSKKTVAFKQLMDDVDMMKTGTLFAVGSWPLPQNCKYNTIRAYYDNAETLSSLLTSASCNIQSRTKLLVIVPAYEWMANLAKRAADPFQLAVVFKNLIDRLSSPGFSVKVLGYLNDAPELLNTVYSNNLGEFNRLAKIVLGANFIAPDAYTCVATVSMKDIRSSPNHMEKVNDDFIAFLFDRVMRHQLTVSGSCSSVISSATSNFLNQKAFTQLLLSLDPQLKIERLVVVPQFQWLNGRITNVKPVELVTEVTKWINAFGKSKTSLHVIGFINDNKSLRSTTYAGRLLEFNSLMKMHEKNDVYIDPRRFIPAHISIDVASTGSARPEILNDDYIAFTFDRIMMYLINKYGMNKEPKTESVQNQSIPQRNQTSPTPSKNGGSEIPSPPLFTVKPKTDLPIQIAHAKIVERWTSSPAKVEEHLRSSPYDCLLVTCGDWPIIDGNFQRLEPPGVTASTVIATLLNINALDYFKHLILVPSPEWLGTNCNGVARDTNKVIKVLVNFANAYGNPPYGNIHILGYPSTPSTPEYGNRLADFNRRMSTILPAGTFIDIQQNIPSRLEIEKHRDPERPEFVNSDLMAFLIHCAVRDIQSNSNIVY